MLYSVFSSVVAVQTHVAIKHLKSSGATENEISVSFNFKTFKFKQPNEAIILDSAALGHLINLLEGLNLELTHLL